MNEISTLLLCMLAGSFLGLVFFGGLWLTIFKGISSKNPFIWFLLSLFLRSAVVLGGFYLIAASQWQRFLACLIGFFIARIVLVRIINLSKERASLLNNDSYGH